MSKIFLNIPNVPNERKILNQLKKENNFRADSKFILFLLKDYQRLKNENKNLENIISSLNIRISTFK